MGIALMVIGLNIAAVGAQITLPFGLIYSSFPRSGGFMHTFLALGIIGIIVGLIITIFGAKMYLEGSEESKRRKRETIAQFHNYSNSNSKRYN